MFGDTFYLYSTHDFSPNNTGFVMKDWRVFSSPDLVSWTLESTLLPQDTPAPPSAWSSCWATDGAQSPSDPTQFFFYLSIGTCEVAVLNASSPVGPWDNFLGAPLLNASFGSSLNPPACFRDPAAFVDVATGEAYIIAGVFDYYIAKLAPDMMSLAEMPRLIEIVNPQGPYGNKTDDKPFMHRRGDVYYLSWGAFVGMGSSPYGPFTYSTSVVMTDYIAPDFRMNSSATPWYTSEDLMDRHGSFFSNAAGQSFFVSNDRSHSADKASPGSYRDSVIGYVNYFANGTLAPVFIDGVGVGSYIGRHIEAEFFMAATGGARKGHDAAGRFGMHALTAAASLGYPNVHGVPSSAAFVVAAANAGARPARVIAVADGAIICEAVVPPTRAWDDYVEARCEARTELPETIKLLELRFAPEGGEETEEVEELLRLDWLALVAA